MAATESAEVVVLDYGAGNLRSVVRAVEHVGFSVDIADAPAALDTARAVILPGVGAAADTMRNLEQRGLAGPVVDYIGSGRPFLGVRMGLQALVTLSEEGGSHPCLNVLSGRVVRLPAGQKVPHMGWNAVTACRPSPLLTGIPDGAHFYFVHSYHCILDDESSVLATTNYGTSVVAIVQHENVTATQFHPEKSGAYGLQIYRNFLTGALGDGHGG